MQGAHLKRSKMLGIELVIVGERILPTQEIEILHTDDYTATRPHTARDRGLGMELAGVLQRLIVVAES